MINLSYSELVQKINNGENFIIIDVREDWEYLSGHLRGAINIPINILSASFPDFDANDPILVYCQHGLRSKRGCEILEKKGFKKVYNLKGGIEEYSLKNTHDLIRY